MHGLIVTFSGALFAARRLAYVVVHGANNSSDTTGSFLLRTLTILPLVEVFQQHNCHTAGDFGMSFMVCWYECQTFSDTSNSLSHQP